MEKQTHKELISEGSWLEKVAMRLVGDADAANDVVQDTYLKALNNEVPADRPLRGWLGRVALNSVRSNHRSRVRRKRREEESNPIELDGRKDETAFDALHKKQVGRRLLEAVTTLDDSFREAIVLRYVEDLSIPEIAKRQGVPVGTAGWRVHEATKRLRSMLEEDVEGELRPWLLALCPHVNSTPLFKPAETAIKNGGTTMKITGLIMVCLLYTSPSPRDATLSRMPSSA